MENEKIRELEEKSKRLEIAYMIYEKSRNISQKEHWKMEWYRVLYVIKEKE